LENWGNRRRAACGGKSKAVSRQRRDWRDQKERESQAATVGRRGGRPFVGASFASFATGCADFSLAPLRLLSPPNPLRWALAGAPSRSQEKYGLKAAKKERHPKGWRSV